MAAPAVSRAGNPPLTPRSVELHLSYIELREFCAQLETFKAGLHGAALGYHSSRFALPGVDGTSQVSLKLVVRRAGKNLRRRAEAQKAWCPPPEENTKRQAQLALQTPSVKRSFEQAFPGDKLEAARAALCDMLEDRYARKHDKSAGINYRDKSAKVKMLRQGQLKRPVERALDALWTCTRYTRERLMLHLPDYRERKAYFDSMYVALTSEPPRLVDVPEFQELYGRVHGRAPDGGPLRVVHADAAVLPVAAETESARRARVLHDLVWGTSS
jgi:hypothetical protein